MVSGEPKSDRSRRTIALTPSTATTLQEHKEKQEAQHTMKGSTLWDSDLIFSDLKGMPLRPNLIRLREPGLCWQSALELDLYAFTMHDILTPL